MCDYGWFGWIPRWLVLSVNYSTQKRLVGYVPSLFWCLPHPRFAIMCILRGDPSGFLTHFGLKCSSWCSVNVGTSGRSACCSVGNVEYPSVLYANKMASRYLGWKNLTFRREICWGFPEMIGNSNTAWKTNCFYEDDPLILIPSVHVPLCVCAFWLCVITT